MNEGIIYILINGAMPGYVKIGRTNSTVEQRMRELDSSGTPLPFECFHASKVKDVIKVENLLHDAFADQRVRPRREFFKLDPERVRSALLLAEIEEVTPRDDVTDNPEDQRALDKTRELRGAFNFSMVNLKPGIELSFVKDQSLKATVIDNKNIEFEGEKMSLSSAALKVVHSMNYTWKQISGPSYWEFEGETLAARRLRYEEAAYKMDD